MRALQIVKARVGLESIARTVGDLISCKVDHFNIGQFKFEFDEKQSRALGGTVFTCDDTGTKGYWLTFRFWMRYPSGNASAELLIHKPNHHTSEIYLKRTSMAYEFELANVTSADDIKHDLADQVRTYPVLGRVALEEREFGFKNLSEDDRRRILFSDVVDRRHIDETKIDSYGSLVGSFSTRGVDNFEVDLTFRDFGSGGYVFRKGEYTVVARFSADLGLNGKVTYAIDLKTLSVQGLVDALAEVGVYKQLSAFMKKWSKESTARVALETPRALDLSTLSKDDITQIVLGIEKYD